MTVRVELIAIAAGFFALAGLSACSTLEAQWNKKEVQDYVLDTINDHRRRYLWAIHCLKKSMAETAREYYAEGYQNGYVDGLTKWLDDERRAKENYCK